MRLAIGVAAAVVILALSGTTAVLLYSRFEQTNHNRVANARIWHGVLCDIEKKLILPAHASTVKKKAALAFYDGLLVNDAHAAPCGFTIGGTK